MSKWREDRMYEIMQHLNENALLKDADLCNEVIQYKTNILNPAKAKALRQLYEKDSSILKKYRDIGISENGLFRTTDDYFMYKLITIAENTPNKLNNTDFPLIDIMPETLRNKLIELRKVEPESCVIQHYVNEIFSLKDLNQAPNHDASVTTNDIDLNFSSSLYNKNIVRAYEKKFFDNWDNLKTFINGL